MPIRRHQGGDAAIFGLAIDLAHVDAEREIPADQIRRDRRRPGKGDPAAIQPEHAPDVAEHQPVRDPVGEPQGQRRRLAVEPAIGHAIAHRHRAAVHPVLERGGILQRDGHAGIELLPDPRHREKRRRLHLAQIVRHRFRAFGEIHHRAQRQRGVVAADPFGDMAERQEHQPLFTIGGGEQIVGVAHLMRHAAIGMHRAFGRTGGARGVDEDRKIVRRRGLRSSHPTAPRGHRCDCVPIAMNSASDITIGSEKPLRPSMSKTTIFCSVGQRARHDSTLSSCSSSSTKITGCGSR